MLAVVFAHFMDGDDVRVPEIGRRLGLSVESFRALAFTPCNGKNRSRLQVADPIMILA
jgi:hypothetical protein